LLKELDQILSSMEIVWLIYHKSGTAAKR